jgi:hypothetical protein
MYNLLLQSSLKTLSNLCFTNKQAQKICFNRYFWINYANLNHYPIIEQTTIKNWLKHFTIYNET